MEISTFPTSPTAGIHKSAAMLGKIAERGPDSRQGVARSFHGAAAHSDDALDHGLALITGLVDRVAGSGTDNRTADSGRQSAGFDLTSGNCLDLHLLSALLQRILHQTDQQPQRQEAAKGQIHDGCTKALREDLDPAAGAVKREAETVRNVDEPAAEAPGSDKFTEHTHDDKHTGIAESLEDAVKETVFYGVLLAESFRPADDDAVDGYSVRT